MLEGIAPHLVRAGLGLGLGILLGAVARWGKFCTLGAVEDVFYARDTRRARAWMLAAAAAIAGTHALEAHAGLNLQQSLYARAHLEWGAMLLGGLAFGFGMALVGTCGFGALLRLGGGDLRALLVLLVLGLSSTMAIGGLTAWARVAVTAPLGLDLAAGSQRLAALLGLSGEAVAAFGYGVALVLAGLALAGTAFRRTGRLVRGGVLIGLLIAAGWWATGIAGHDDFEVRTVGSFSFARPVGDSLLYAMLASGARLDFGVGSVLGVVVGAFAAARRRGEFHWEAPDDPREVRRHVFGAFLMGTGGVTALGCSIGQGLSGLSTLSAGSLLAVAAILAGARAGLYVLLDRHT